MHIDIFCRFPYGTYGHFFVGALLTSHMDIIAGALFENIGKHVGYIDQGHFSYSKHGYSAYFTSSYNALFTAHLDIVESS